MPFKFEKLKVWDLALDFVEMAYSASSMLPREEEFNLKSQMRRAATSVSLNIAEGSIGQSNAEQARFLGMAIRSLIEVIACGKLIQRHRYATPEGSMETHEKHGEFLTVKLQAFRGRLVAPVTTSAEG